MESPSEMMPDACAVAARAAAELAEELRGANDADAAEAAIHARVAAALDRCLATLSATGLWSRDNLPPSHEIWKVAGTILELGDLQHRAKFKPRGYAGDFEMMTDFWNRTVRGDTPLARGFDAYFQKETAVDAVRSRIKLAAKLIAERCTASTHDEFRVVSIGSGPAIDLFEAARALPEAQRRKLRFTLLDMDEGALAAATERLASIVGPHQVYARRENLYRLAKLRCAASFPGDVDFVLCSGLFDYLADDVATAQLGLFWKALRGGGQLMVGNFAPHNPSRAYMEWIGNWYLLYRTADDLLRLAAGAPIPPETRRVVAEETGCDLFLIAAKPEI